MTTVAVEEIPPFVLTEGGPGAAVLRRLRLAPFGARAGRTALVLVAVTWVPLLLMSAVEGLALGKVQVPFLYDIAANVRFLVAVPMLVLAEIPIGMRLRQATAHFVTAGLVRQEEQTRFSEIILATLRFRDSRVAELVVLGASYVSGYALMAMPMQGGSTWHTRDPSGHVAAVGYWYMFVSLPIFLFLLLRWMFRMLVWARFLRKVSALDLELTPTHPDGAGGLGFLGKATIPFGGLLFAVSAVTSSAIAGHVLFEHLPLERFQITYAALVVLGLAVFTGPLLVFVPTLAQLKRKGLLEYGTLASRYTQRFDRKWVRGVDVPDDTLLGTGDIQSLADLGNSYEFVKRMGAVPIEVKDLVRIAAGAVVPAVPLAALVMPLSEIVKDVLRLLA
jgi:hypothetical protein